MKQCPQCGTEYPDDSSFCPTDGAPLIEPSGMQGDDLEGTVLNGKWLVEEALGEGGMGVVYRGHQLKLQRKVAIKVIRPGLVQRDVVARFKREAQAVAAINHPNCVTIYDFDEADSGTLYIAMEFCSGIDLAGRISAEGPPRLKETLEIASQTASALAAAHARNIIHRDLKPENIFLSEDDDGSTRVKVLDFGIAKMLTPHGDDGGTDITKTGVIGTPAYMSPEQLAGKTPDPRTDLYSLGCVLYEMITGVSPFEDLPLVQMMAAHTELPPPDFESHGLKVPPAVAALVLKLLEKKRRSRFQSAAELREALEELLLEPENHDVAEIAVSARSATQTFDWGEAPVGALDSESEIDPLAHTQLPTSGDGDASEESEEGGDASEASEEGDESDATESPPPVNRPDDGLPGLRNSAPRQKPADRTWTINVPARPRTLAWVGGAVAVVALVAGVAVFGGGEPEAAVEQPSSGAVASEPVAQSEEPAVPAIPPSDGTSGSPVIAEVPDEPDTGAGGDDPGSESMVEAAPRTAPEPKPKPKPVAKVEKKEPAKSVETPKKPRVEKPQPKPEPVEAKPKASGEADKKPGDDDVDALLKKMHQD